MLGQQRVILCDWDNTFRPGFIVESWQQFMVRSGLITEERTWPLVEQFDSFRAGRIDYTELAETAGALYGASVRGLHIEDVRVAAKEFVHSDVSRLFPFVLPLLSSLSPDYLLIYISGAPQIVLDAYRDEVIGGRAHGLRIGRENGGYSGLVIENPSTASCKQRIVKEILSAGHDIAAAFGDSVSDLPMFSVAERRIVVANRELSDQIGAYLVEDPVRANDSAILRVMSTN